MWDPFANVYLGDPRLLTLYHRQMQIIDMQNHFKWNKNGLTAIIDHGCNPGLVSHFVKRALIDMTEYILNKSQNISERDTQITNQPKKVNEFVNTWSVDGITEEAVASSEMGWGTHERNIPEGMLFHDENKGPCNLVCLTQKGMNTW
jgi:homospermidine synthase